MEKGKSDTFTFLNMGGVSYFAFLECRAARELVRKEQVQIAEFFTVK